MGNWPDSASRKVVFPEPLGAMRPAAVPGLKKSDPIESIVVLPYPTLTSRSSSPWCFFRGSRLFGRTCRNGADRKKDRDVYQATASIDAPLEPEPMNSVGKHPT